MLEFHVFISVSETFPVLQYTEKEGLRLGLVGWVKNTASGTVVGQVQGPAAMVEEMWDTHTETHTETHTLTQRRAEYPNISL